MLKAYSVIKDFYMGMNAAPQPVSPQESNPKLQERKQLILDTKNILQEVQNMVTEEGSKEKAKEKIDMDFGVIMDNFRRTFSPDGKDARLSGDNGVDAYAQWFFKLISGSNAEWNELDSQHTSSEARIEFGKKFHQNTNGLLRAMETAAARES